MSEAKKQANSDASVDRVVTRHGPIVGWLVYSPIGDECDFYIFTEQVDAWDKKQEFDECDPDHEHVLEALVCHPSWDYREYE